MTEKMNTQEFEMQEKIYTRKKLGLPMLLLLILVMVASVGAFILGVIISAAGNSGGASFDGINRSFYCCMRHDSRT